MEHHTDFAPFKNTCGDRDWFNAQFSNEFSSHATKPGIYSERRLVDDVAYDLSEYGDMRVYFSREEQFGACEREEVRGSLEPPFPCSPTSPRARGRAIGTPKSALELTELLSPAEMARPKGTLALYGREEVRPNVSTFWSHW